MKRQNIYQVGSQYEALILFGEEDRYLKLIEEGFKVLLKGSGSEIHISGEEDKIALTIELFDLLLDLIDKEIPLDETQIRYYIEQGQNGHLKDAYLEQLEKIIAFNNRQRPIRPKSIGQSRYVEAILKNDVAFGIGPAGTGKTYLAVVLGVKALKDKKVDKIILVRPAVEAGEQLGFLPGDIEDKIDPYLRPLYDALYDMLGVEGTERLIDKKVIEIAPLAYMRGRTLENAFIILDEAQNTTREQMKMFLTRFGYYSKVIVTGDPSQVDLKSGATSGLSHSVKLLQEIKGIKVVSLTEEDVVRHPLVRKIIKAYDKEGEE